MNACARAVVAAALALSGCKNSGHPAIPEAAGSADAAVSLAHVQRMRTSCQPDSRAELVIAAASDDGVARCVAMQALAAQGPEGFSLNGFYIRRSIAALDRPANREALRRMLHEPEPLCHADPSASSPTRVALQVLAEFPVASLRAEVEKLPSNIEEREATLLAYKRFDERHDSAASSYIDSLTADASSAGFERLVEFVANGYPWPASTPSPAPGSDDAKHVHIRVIAALQWLDFLADQHPDAVNNTLDCVQDVKQGIRTGRLGEVLLSNFDKFDADVRYAVLGVLRDTARTGSRPQLERIATDDSDKRVRDAAELALRFVDTGGYSTVRLPSGSAVP